MINNFKKDPDRNIPGRESVEAWMYRAGNPVGRLTTILLIATLFFSEPTQAAENAMLDLDLSALMQIQVTSAGRKEQNLKDIPAAVFVIEQDDIRNSGVTSIPEALRMVPGIQVARISSSKWAISSRGFNGTFSNKLLVQIDGRSVYSPTYSGVYWDIQQVVLEDVERIEVIRGPGATLWGANAVNGIINIITKQSSDTQGTMLSVGGGNHEDSMASLRHGFQLGDDVYGRFFLSRHDQDSYQLLSDKTDAYDDWNITHGGFRLDGDQGIADSWTFQGDGYHGDSHQIVDNYWLPGATFPLQVKDTTDVAGFNLLGRWTHRFTERSSSTLQTYFDQTTREDIYLQQKQYTFDVDFQHRFQLGTRNDLIWGLGFRTITDDFDNTYQYSMLPDSRTDDLWSAFVQDEINLVQDKLWLTLGVKFEVNDYTGYETQPNLRLFWKAADRHSFWASVARAVRTPSRAEDSGQITLANLPIPPAYPKITIDGNQDLKAEELIAYETGYRYFPSQSFSLDLALFYNDYKNIQSFQQLSFASPIFFANGLEGYAYGLELSTGWKPLPWLTTEANYSFIDIHLTETIPSIADSISVTAVAENSVPQHQISVRSGIKLSTHIDFNLWYRYVGTVKVASIQASSNNIKVNNYSTLDANLQWRINEAMTLTLAGQNLLDPYHLEFVGEVITAPVEIGRSIYAKLTWQF